MKNIGKDIVNYDTDQLKKYYKKMVKDASKSIDNLVILKLSYDYSLLFETPLVDHVKHSDFLDSVQKYIDNHGGYTPEDFESETFETPNVLRNVNTEIFKSSKILNVANKRSVDLISRHHNIQATMSAVYLVIVKEYIAKTKEGEKDKKNIQESLTHALKNYQYTQLDVSNLLLIAEKLPLNEIYFFLDQVEEPTHKSFNMWNLVNEATNILRIKEDKLNVSREFYKYDIDSIKTRDDLIEKVDDYLEPLINYDYFKEDIYVLGGGAIE